MKLISILNYYNIVNAKRNIIVHIKIIGIEFTNLKIKNNNYKKTKTFLW